MARQPMTGVHTVTKPKCACLNPAAPRALFGSLRVLPSGRHQARYTGPDGRTYRGPHTFDTHGDADAWLAGVRSDISRSAWKAPTSRKAAPNTFGEFAEDWMLTRPLRPRTKDHYRKLLDRHILPSLGDKPITEITAPVVRSWYATLDSSLATLRAHCYSLLRTILTTAVDDELIAANPCRIRGAGQAKRKSKTEPLKTNDQLERLVLAMPDRYRLAVLLSTWCALRIGEVTELRRKDIDLRDRERVIIHVRRAVTWIDGETEPLVGAPKSEAGARAIAVPPHVVEFIERHLETYAQEGPDGLLFPSTRGIQLRSSTIYNAYWPARKAAGLSKLRWHDLRHTGATWAAQDGATLKELMVRIGHSTPAAALRYQHAAEERDAELAARLSVRAAPGKPVPSNN